jgi:membrane-associated phospholipid phosphatase
MTGEVVLFDARRKSTPIRHAITATLLTVAFAFVPIVSRPYWVCVIFAACMVRCLAGSLDGAAQPARAQQTIGTVE